MCFNWSGKNTKKMGAKFGLLLNVSSAKKGALRYYA